MNRFNRRRAEAVARKSKLQQTGVTNASHHNSSALPSWRMALLGTAAIGAMAVSGDIVHAQSAGADNATVSSGDIINGGTVDFLAGNDTISFGANLAGTNGATVTGGADDDSISFTRRIGEPAGTSGTLRGDAGGDIIRLTGFAIVGFSATSSGEILGDAGEDTITIDNSVVGLTGDGTVSGGADNDFIVVGNNSRIGADMGSTGQVLGDAGDDTITIEMSEIGFNGAATVSGGLGNDSIAIIDSSHIGERTNGSGQVLGDAGDDTITIDNSYVAFSGNATISGGADNDSISFTGTSSISGTSQVLGDAGNDTISIDSSVNITAGATTIDGGSGNDVLGVNFVAGGNAIDFSDFDNFEVVELSGSATVDIAALPADFSIVGIGDNSTITLATTTVSDLFQIDGTLQGTAGADSVTLNSSSVIGRDENSTGQLLGDAGADTITLDSAYVGFSGAGTVSGGADNDSIAISNNTNLGYASGSSGQVLGDGGDDTITLDRALVGRSGSGAVDGGANNDLITISNSSSIGRNEGGTGQVLGGVGEDTITINGGNIGQSGAATVSGGADNDSIVISNFASIATNADGTGQILGEEGADTITLDRTFVGSRGAATVSGGADNDSIALSTFSSIARNENSTGQVLGDAGEDTITVVQSSIGDRGAGTVSGGAGNDLIALSNGSEVGNIAGSSGQVLGDAGDDTITLDQSRVGFSGAGTVSGGEGNDSIALNIGSDIGNEAGSTGQVLGDAGEDTITLNQVSVGYSGAGTVDGGADNDSIALSNGSIIADQENSTGQVLGGTGNDIITLVGGRVGSQGDGTVDGGAGDDSISLSNSNTVGFFAGSSGAILGDAGNDTIVVDSSTVARNGQATIDTGVGNDQVTINAAVVAEAEDATASIITGDGTDSVTISGSTNFGSNGSATLSTGDDNDTISFSSSYAGVFGTASISSGDGDDTISFDNSFIGSSGAATVSGGEGNDTIAVTNNSMIGFASGSSGVILGDAGNDTILVDNSLVGNYGNATIDTGIGGDDLTITNASRVAAGSTATVSILTGDGADSVTISNNVTFAERNDATLSTGDDNDTISITSNVAIALNFSSSASISSGDGDDTLLFDGAQVGVSGDATIDAGLGNDTITIQDTMGAFNGSSIGAFSSSSSQVLGGAGTDSITIASTTIGDGGQATVDGGADADVITLTPAAGFGGRSILGEQTGSIGTILGGDGDDTISLGNAFIGDEGTGIVDGGDGADSVSIDNGELGNEVTGSGQILGGLGDDTINLSSTNVGDRGQGTVDGGDGSDVIELTNGSSIGFEGAGSSGQVLGGAGSDTITITGSAVGQEGSATVSGGADGDSITIDAMSAVGFQAGSSGQVLGDGGDDTITVNGSAIGYSGSGTIDGGEGTDNISFDGAVIGLNAGSTGQVLGGAGNDTISFNDTDIGIGGAATVDTGAGNDSITLTGTTELGANASINTGAGNDTVSFELTVEIDDNTIINGGTGTDSLIVLATGDQEIDAEAVEGFEQFSASGGGTLTLTGDASFTEGVGAAENGELTTNGTVTAAGVTVEDGGEFTVDGALLSTRTGDAADNVARILNPDVTIVEQSTLRNNGTFTSAGGIFIEDDGILAGNGIFNGPVVANNGVISPGNSIGVQTFNNGLTLNGGNTLLIEVSDGAADRVDVVGAVEINGATLQLDDLAPVATDLNAVFTIVDNDGTDLITGTGFGTIVDNLAFLDPTVIINGGDGNDVSLQFRPLEIDVASIATSGNQTAIGEAFNSAPSTDPGIQALLAEFTPLTFAQARAGLNSLSGETHASTQFATGSAGLFFADSVNNALGGFGLGDQARSNNGPTASAALQALALTPEETAARSYPADLVLSENSAKVDRGYVFGRGLYRQSNIDADGNGAATDTQNRGFIAGGGFNFSERFSAGVSIGYLRTDVDVDALNSESETDAIIANIHARYKHNNYDLTGNLGYAFSNIDTERQVAVGGINQRAVADYDADTVFGSAELGYTAVINQFAFRPFVGGAFSYTSTDAFTETGAGAANLVVASSNNTLGQFTLGVSASTQFNVGPALIVPRLEVAYDRLVGDLTPATSAAFQAGGVSFNSVGAAPGRSRGRISAGFAAVLSARVNSFIDYQGIFSGSDRTHAVRSGLKVKF